MPKRSLPIYLDNELWREVDTIVAEVQADGGDISRSRWVEAAIRRALASTEPLEIRPTPKGSFPIKKIKPPVDPTPGAGERVHLAVEPVVPAEIPITSGHSEALKQAVLGDRLEREALSRIAVEDTPFLVAKPAEGVADPSPPATPPGTVEEVVGVPAPATPPGPERPQRARVPSMAEHLALNPQLAVNDLDSHMALNPDLAGTPMKLDVPPPTGTAVADFSQEPTLPAAAIEKLKDETGPNPVVVHVATVLYEKVDGKWCWTCPDAGITGVSSYVSDIRADAWETLTNHYGHDNLTLEVRRKP